MSDPTMPPPIVPDPDLPTPIVPNPDVPPPPMPEPVVPQPVVPDPNPIDESMASLAPRTPLTRLGRARPAWAVMLAA